MKRIIYIVSNEDKVDWNTIRKRRDSISQLPQINEVKYPGLILRAMEVMNAEVSKRPTCGWKKLEEDVWSKMRHTDTMRN